MEIESPEPNRPIPVGTERISLGDGEGVQGEICISLRLLPSPRLVMEGEVSLDLSSSFRLVFEHKPVNLSLLDRGSSIEVVLTSASVSDRCKFTAIPVREPFTALIIGDPTEVQFQLINFPETLVPEEQDGRTVLHREVFFSAGDWRIHLRPVDAIAEKIKTIKSEGGYAVTYSGVLKRVDNEPFKVALAEDILHALFQFFSFARGTWTGPILPVGLDGTGKRVWEQWGASSVTPWRSVSTWFDSHHGSLLGEVFAGFWQRWNARLWRESLQRTIYWYIGSNLGLSGVEGSIILSQTALELLAWTLLVEERATLSKDGFKRLPAADQIRLLLSTMGVPLELPPQLIALAALQRQQNWSDGPAAFTAMRNSIVHPGDSKRLSGMGFEPRQETWYLGQWYIELALLWLSRHSGVYGNRLHKPRWAGQVEPVPWSA